MILYRLICAAGHEFDSWFRNGAAFDRQSAKGLLSCPDCGSNEVSKAVMAPRLNRGAGVDIAPVPPDVAGREMLRQMRRKIESECEHVGERFAEEARAIHEGAAEPRGIYGQAKPEEAESLREEGIEFAVLPWISVHDA
jgi:hypothetical protein